jgi:hypothetical protein
MQVALVLNVDVDHVRTEWCENGIGKRFCSSFFDTDEAQIEDDFGASNIAYFHPIILYHFYPFNQRQKNDSITTNLRTPHDYTKFSHTASCYAPRRCLKYS